MTRAAQRWAVLLDRQIIWGETPLFLPRYYRSQQQPLYKMSIAQMKSYLGQRNYRRYINWSCYKSKTHVTEVDTVI
jgi:hypothetical protein